jgi:hypothetical protein
MDMILIFLGLLLISFFWALYSMRDYRVPKNLEKVIPHTKQGRIIFFKGHTRHYPHDKDR